MTFSDEDLKRLKEIKQKYNYFNFPTAWNVNEAYDLIEALLARLKAAERYIFLGAQCQGVDPKELDEADRAWRKAAGK